MNISQYIRAFGSVHKGCAKNHKKFLHFSLKRFVALRNKRVDDLLSEEIRRSTRIESELFSLGLPKMLLCVDGRVLAKLVASLHEGGIRTPAADTIEFLPGMKGNSLFLSEGRLARFIKERFSLYESMILFLDSHLHCAARKASSIDICGHDLKDDGLLDDVLQKKKMADALLRYVEKTFKKKKKFFPIHTSFDPHTGFLFMGLEKEDVLKDSRIVCEGFTEGNLMALSEEKKILSTFLWAQKNGLLFDLFTSFVFELDYEKSYCQSTLQFWENVKKISIHALPRIEKELLAVFPNLSGKKLELRERSVFLLANAYTAFLLNHVKNGYSYAKHDESVIVITPGDRGPYVSFRSFTVDPVNANLSSVLKFIEGLIRSNRAERRCLREERAIIDTLFKENYEDFVQSPVPVFFFQKIEKAVSQAWIEKIEKVDWSDIPQLPWMYMSRKEFAVYLKKKLPGIPTALMNPLHYTGCTSARDLVVACMDLRTQKILKQLISSLGLEDGTYDLVTVPGGAGNLHQCKICGRISKHLHETREIILVVHEDCGAGAKKEDLFRAAKVARSLKMRYRTFYMFRQEDSWAWEEIFFQESSFLPLWKIWLRNFLGFLRPIPEFSERR